MTKCDFTALESGDDLAKHAAALHFYDFMQICLLRFLSSSKLTSRLDSAIYYLSNNLTLHSNQKYSIRAQTSADLLHNLFVVNMANDKLALVVLKFISDFYEMDAKENAANQYLKDAFYNMINSLATDNKNEKKSKTLLKNLQIYFVTKCYPMCFSLMCSSPVYSSQSVQVKLFCELVDPKLSSNFLLNLFKKLELFVINWSGDSSRRVNSMQASLIYFTSVIDFENCNLLHVSNSKILFDQTASLVKTLHEYFEKKLVPLNESSFKNHQIFRKLLSIFHKLSLKLNLNAEIEFMLTLLTKAYAKLDTGLKLLLVDFVYSILKSKSKCAAVVADMQTIVGKICEAVGLLMNDESSHLRFFCLECFKENMPVDESTSVTPFVSAVLCGLARKSKQVSEEIMAYMIELAGMSANDEASYVHERFLGAVSRHGHVSGRDNQRIAMLDDTMNVLMGIDASQQQTTATGGDEENEDEAMGGAAECEMKISEIANEVSSLAGLLKVNYNDRGRSVPESMKTRINNIIDTLSIQI
jgi:hypothetical protein